MMLLSKLLRGGPPRGPFHHSFHHSFDHSLDQNNYNNYCNYINCNNNYNNHNNSNNNYARSPMPIILSLHFLAASPSNYLVFACL
jgi:hypothetical protein